MKTKAYACYNKDQKRRACASSGGIYIRLAEQVIKNAGKVFAVVYDENLETKHIEMTNEKQLQESQGSKYIPSRLNDIFIKIEEYLKCGSLVMFVGTPCQCYGLLTFLGKPYENLIEIDFICHGVPSRAAWRKYLADLKLEETLKESSSNLKREIVAINMRDKSSGWSRYGYSWHVAYSDGDDKFILQDRVSYMKGFTSNLYLRPSCYECRFKGVDRRSDITLGDYWGVWDIQPDMDDDKGTSLVLVHTEKGQKLLDAIIKDIEIKEAVLGKAVERNPSIIASATMNKMRADFFHRIYAGENFDDAVKACTADKNKSAMDRVKGKMKRTWNKLKPGGGGNLY